jgi:mRNA interferase RelE/StbE
MADYSVTFARSARKELEKLPSSIAQRIIARIEALVINPRTTRSVKLQGNRNLWRIRVGDYRVVYHVDDAARIIDVSIIRHRRDAYRDL